MGLSLGMKIDEHGNAVPGRLRTRCCPLQRTAITICRKQLPVAVVSCQ